MSRWFTNRHIVEWALDEQGVYQGALTICLFWWQPNWTWAKYNKPFTDARVYSFWLLWLHVHLCLPKDHK